MESRAIHLLLIDGDASAEDFADRLRAPGISVEWCRSVNQGRALALKGGFDVLICEVPDKDCAAFAWVREMREARLRLPLICLSSCAESSFAIEAIKAGAYDFFLKPADPGEVVGAALKACEDVRRTSKPVEIGEVYPEQDTIVGRSREMRDIYKQLGRISAQPVNVLIRGETGTGKELIARAIFQHGHRAHKPFVAVNCAAIPEPLLESELFGHEKGAFTGADRVRIGRFEQAHGGTIFLDEIGDLKAPMQVKLLRVLQEKMIHRVGGDREIPVDVRVIAATHRNLEQMVRAGEFREDLFYRLNVASILIPPLRERRDDIALLVDYFLRRFGREYNIEGPSIAPAAVEFLARQDWPVNIRQLQNVIRRALLLSRGYTISWQDCRAVLEENDLGSAETPSLRDLVRATLTRVIEGQLEAALPELESVFEREVYSQAISRSGGNQAKAARWLGVSRLTLREKLRTYGIHPGE
ncbi:MAG: two-component system, NtrC family, nitrogen regulation response regulator GlnG [Verrucomicrobia bacterium]|nr:MAG: two-component system, NtrC family, nitrogen regulation response regulator GlnG [Verrucomicrobiota bacterium]